MFATKSEWKKLFLYVPEKENLGHNKRLSINLEKIRLEYIKIIILWEDEKGGGDFDLRKFC